MVERVMERVIVKEVCDICGGIGHIPNCSCQGAVDFIMGCCKKCHGDGHIRLPDELRPVEREEEK